MDLRQRPEVYRVGRGEQGIFHAEPYKGELLPLWKIKTPGEARNSAAAICERYREYLSQEDFVGMDVARKFLQMGHTRARRYANYRGGRKKDWDGNPVPFGSGDPEKGEVAEIFRQKWRAVADDAEYQRLKERHRARYEKG